MKRSARQSLHKALLYAAKAQLPDGSWDGPISSTLFQTALTVHACPGSENMDWFKRAVHYIEACPEHQKPVTRNRYAERYFLQHEWLFHECARALVLHDHAKARKICRVLKSAMKSCRDERLMRKFLILSMLLMQAGYVEWQDVPDSVRALIGTFIESKDCYPRIRPWKYVTYLCIAARYLHDHGKPGLARRLIREIMGYQSADGGWSKYPFITAFISIVLNGLGGQDLGGTANYLTQWQNLDGGFRPFRLPVWDTAFMVKSLKSLKTKNIHPMQTWIGDQIRRGEHFIMNQRQAAGWAWDIGGSPEFDSTGMCLYSLQGTDGVNMQIKDGMKYLSDNQKADGSWGTWDMSEDSSVDVTAHSVMGLDNDFIVDKNDGASYLANNHKDGVWYPGWVSNLYYGISQSLIAIGMSGIDFNASKTIEFIKKSQNPDGGWGDYPGSKSNVMGTANVLLATSCPALFDANITEDCVAWLEQSQLPNGTWPVASCGIGPYPLRYSDHAITHSLCVWALSAIPIMNR